MDVAIPRKVKEMVVLWFKAESKLVNPKIKKRGDSIAMQKKKYKAKQKKPIRTAKMNFNDIIYVSEFLITLIIIVEIVVADQAE